MGAVLGTLSEFGYGWAYRVLDSQYFGVAQRRRRVFIVGRSGGRSRSCADVLFEPESVCGNPPPSRAQGQEVAASAGRGVEGDSRAASWDPRSVTSRANRSRVEFGNPAQTLNSGGLYVIQDGREIEKHQNGLGVTQADVAYTLDGTGAQGFAECHEPYPCEHDAELERLWAENDARLDGVVGALDSECGASKLTDQTLRNGHDMPVAYWDGGEVSDTLDVSVLVKRQTMPEKRRMAAFVGWSRVRRLTPRECERLQGFPDDWTAGQADTHRYRQIGNAVTVPVIEWLAARIRQVHSF